MMAMPEATRLSNRPLVRKLVSQGTLLLSGFAGAQIFAFARNALLGHWLAKGDFGIAATITLMLQLIEMTSDLGADRLIIQAKDGDSPRLMATAHLMLVLRGILTAFALYASAGLIARFFHIEEAQWAFEAVALSPLIRGLTHLDPRRAQRHLDNRPLVVTEVLPQAAALILTIPALLIAGGYAAIVWLSILQAAFMVAASHWISERPYAVAFDREIFGRLFEFGWPILLSALPLIAVYQGDRILIGKVYGMEVLAGYTAAFMIAMIPGLFAAKIATALILPALAEVQDQRDAFSARYTALCEFSAVCSALYVALFIIAGGSVLPLAFGTHYTGLGVILSWLALMWAVRMVQTVPGMALISRGETKPFLVAGLLRAGALIPAVIAALAHGSIETIAAMGVIGELASLTYVARRAARRMPGLDRILLTRSLIILPAAAGATFIASLLPPGSGLLEALVGAALAGAMIMALSITLMPQTKHVIQTWHGHRLDATVPQAQSSL